MYDLIYDYLLTHLFNSTDLEGATKEVMGLTLNMNEWLAHTTTIICIGLIVLCAIFFIKWLFRLVGGLFLLR